MSASRRFLAGPLKRARAAIKLKKTRLKDRTLAPNIVVLLLDAVARQQLHRALPLTSAVLERPEWIGFERYSLAGANSGPNQFALYTGQKLHGRNLTSNKNTAVMLWTRLKDEGCACALSSPPSPCSCLRHRRDAPL